MPLTLADSERVVPPFVASLGILAYLITVAVIITAERRVGDLSPTPLEFVLVDAARSLLLMVAFASACFLSFWLVAPIVAGLTFELVVRTFIASGVAFVSLIPVGFVVQCRVR